jgi:hypothetical protein
MKKRKGFRPQYHLVVGPHFGVFLKRADTQVRPYNKIR